MDTLFVNVDKIVKNQTLRIHDRQQTLHQFSIYCMIIPDSSVIRSTGKRPESLPDIEPTVFGFVSGEREIKPGGVTEGEADGETEEETEEAAVGETDGEI